MYEKAMSGCHGGDRKSPAVIKNDNITLDKASTGTSRAYTLARLKREWLPWCRENLRFHHDVAGNYMRLYRDKDKFGTIPNLGLTEAYRLLSQPAGDGCGEAEDVMAAIAEAVERERIEKQKANAANQYQEPSDKKLSIPSRNHHEKETAHKAAEMFNTNLAPGDHSRMMR